MVTHQVTRASHSIPRAVGEGGVAGVLVMHLVRGEALLVLRRHLMWTGEAHNPLKAAITFARVRELQMLLVSVTEPPRRRPDTW